MALSNSQYDELMRTYEQRQLDNEHALRKRYETACSMIPKLPALDDAISSISIKQARLLLDGHEDALSELKEEISRLSAQKQALLCSHGFPEDYLELHYLCPDCKDTGYIGTNKCHCFKKAIVDLLYTQSNLQEIFRKCIYKFMTDVQGSLYSFQRRTAGKRVFVVAGIIIKRKRREVLLFQNFLQV